MRTLSTEITVARAVQNDRIKGIFRCNKLHFILECFTFMFPSFHFRRPSRHCRRISEKESQMRADALFTNWNNFCCRRDSSVSAVPVMWGPIARRRMPATPALVKTTASAWTCRRDTRELLSSVCVLTVSSFSLLFSPQIEF